jgi:hypothetical protein
LRLEIRRLKELKVFGSLRLSIVVTIEVLTDVLVDVFVDITIDVIVATEASVRQEED